MMRKHLLLLLLLVGATPFVGADASQRQDIGTDVEHRCRKGEVIVKLRAEAGGAQTRADVQSSLSEVLDMMGAYEVKSLSRAFRNSPQRHSPLRTDEEWQELSSVRLLRFDTTRVESVQQAIDLLSTIDEVEIAEPNYIMTILPTGEPVEVAPQAARLQEQWGLMAMRMTELWQKPIVNSRRPVIAIVDTGVDTTHPDLKDNIAEGGYDMVNDTTIINDFHGHGTHCAGVAAAAGIQVAGANPNALILPIVVIGEDGTGSIFDIMLGILKAVENGADIVSLSLGGASASKLYHDVIKKAAKSAIIVAAAGNEGYCMHTTHRDLHGMAIPRYANIPGAYPEVFGVMATDQDGELAIWSNFDCDGPMRYTNDRSWGYQLRVPGANILSTLPDGKYGYMSGTSMATPMAAGAISRLLQCRNFASREHLLRSLVMTTRGCIDVMGAYESTTSTLHPGVFVENIDGIDYTFVETSDSTAQMGDGTSPAAPAGSVPASLTVPNEVRGLALTTIAPHAFQGCTALKKISLGWCVEDIGDQAFTGCTALKELAFATRFPPTCPKTAFDASHFKTVTLRNARGYAENFNTEAPWKDFLLWKELDLTTGNRFWETIDAQNTLMTFLIYNKDKGYLQVGDGERAVDSLRAGKLVIPDVVRGMKVIFICDEAFLNNNLLTNITLPTTLSSIWDNAFAGCSSLTEITLPWRVYYLGTKAFYGCKKMKTLTFSSSISTIGSKSFAECNSLEKIYMPCQQPPDLPDDVFSVTTYDKARLYVPYGRKADYSNARGWKSFKHIEETWFDAIEDLSQYPTVSPSVVYDLQGRKIRIGADASKHQNIGADASKRQNIETLKPGIYIIGGRIVKI